MRSDNELDLLFNGHDEFSIERRKKEYGIGPDELHWDGYPLGEDELLLIKQILEKALERKEKMENPQFKVIEGKKEERE